VVLGAGRPDRSGAGCRRFDGGQVQLSPSPDSAQMLRHILRVSFAFFVWILDIVVQDFCMEVSLSSERDEFFQDPRGYWLRSGFSGLPESVH